MGNFGVIFVQGLKKFRPEYWYLVPYRIYSATKKRVRDIAQQIAGQDWSANSVYAFYERYPYSISAGAQNSAVTCRHYWEPPIDYTSSHPRFEISTEKN